MCSCASLWRTGPDVIVVPLHVHILIFILNQPIAWWLAQSMDGREYESCRTLVRLGWTILLEGSSLEMLSWAWETLYHKSFIKNWEIPVKCVSSKTQDFSIKFFKLFCCRTPNPFLCFPYKTTYRITVVGPQQHNCNKKHGCKTGFVQSKFTG